MSDSKHLALLDEKRRRRRSNMFIFLLNLFGYGAFLRRGTLNLKQETFQFQSSSLFLTTTQNL